MTKCYEHEEFEYNAQPNCALPDEMECPYKKVQAQVKCYNCKHLGWGKEDSDNVFFGWCNKIVDSPDLNIERTCQWFERATNADRIRIMSDIELAKLFYGLYSGCINLVVNQTGIKAEIKFDNSEGSEAVFLKYLQQPAKEDTDG